MSIESEINRIKNNVASAYTAVEEKGGTVPEEKTSAGLSNAIQSIPTGGATDNLQGFGAAMVPIEFTPPDNKSTNVIFVIYPYNAIAMPNFCLILNTSVGEILVNNAICSEGSYREIYRNGESYCTIRFVVLLRAETGVAEIMYERKNFEVYGYKLIYTT